MFNACKDDIDLMQVPTEAFSMSTMFQGSNCTNFRYTRALEPLQPSKRSRMLNFLTTDHLILINPATSCTPDRSFSATQKIKTWLRSTMKTKRFNNLSILSNHKELTNSINLVDIGHEFASKYDECRMNLGKYVPSDLL